MENIITTKRSLDELLRVPVTFRPASSAVRERSATDVAEALSLAGHRITILGRGSNKRARDDSQGKDKSLHDDNKRVRGNDASEADMDAEVHESDDENSPPAPKRVLVPAGSVTAQWTKVLPPAAGLMNLGNTCFMSSVLQLLLSSPPLVRYLMSAQHSRTCHMSVCALCALEELVGRVYGTGDGRRHSSHIRAVKPTALLAMLPKINRNFRPYRQEDAHEFLRYFLDACQNALLQTKELKALDHASKETSLIYRIYGGRLRQQVQCLSCQHCSNTFQSFQDLSLDTGYTSLQKALSAFCQPELLRGGNQYRCDKCGKMVDARKHVSIWQTPPLLTIHFNRFAFHGHTAKLTKVTKPIEYPEMLDLTPYCAPDNQSRDKGPRHFKLTGVLVHAGSSTRSGHYYSYIRASNGMWYAYDDEIVSSAKLRHVLAQQAYILMYAAATDGSSDASGPSSSMENGRHEAAVATKEFRRAHKMSRSAREKLGSKRHLHGVNGHRHKR